MFLALPAAAGDLPTTAPESAGLGRLDRVTQFFRDDTGSKRLPDAAMLEVMDDQAAMAAMAAATAV